MASAALILHLWFKSTRFFSDLQSKLCCFLAADNRLVQIGGFDFRRLAGVHLKGVATSANPHRHHSSMTLSTFRTDGKFNHNRVLQERWKLTMADKGHLTDVHLSCLDSPHSSRKNSDEPRQTPECSAKERLSDETTVRTDSNAEQENLGAIIRKGQQWKALLATSLQSFWVIGQ